MSSREAGATFAPLKSGVLVACVALVLAGALGVRAWQAFPRQSGIDFYHYWGIARAKASVLTGQTPYAHPAAYARVLNAIADGSDDARLRAANHERRDIAPTGTPFFYAAMAFLPRAYASAHFLHTALLYAAALLAVFLLARLRGVPAGSATCAALAVVLTFDPFGLDFRVGNVNSLQLLFVTALLALAVRGGYSGSLWLAGLAVLVVYKPNTLWIAITLALHHWTVAGTRPFARAAGIAALCGFAAMAYGAWYFGAPFAWPEWLAYARGLDGTGLPLTLANGNVSVAMLLANTSNAYGPAGFGAILGAALVVALACAMSSTGKRTDLVAASAKRAFSDPWFAASVGVLLTFATSPLVWPHYLAFALIPIAWLIGNGRVPRLGTACALAGYAALSTPLINAVAAGGNYALAQALLVCSWMALLPGVLAFAAREHGALKSAAAGAAPS